MMATTFGTFMINLLTNQHEISIAIYCLLAYSRKNLLIGRIYCLVYCKSVLRASYRETAKEIRSVWPYHRIVPIVRFNSSGSSESLVNLNSLHGRSMKKGGGGEGERKSACLPHLLLLMPASLGRHCTHCDVAMIVSI